jgi:uncharacterized membrane protein YgdD (TMEM256/DUF423 family)
MFKELNYWRLAGALFAVTAVVLDAYAAHGIDDPNIKMTIERAANYQLIHAFALIVASLFQGRLAWISCRCFAVGIVLFCGSIECKYLLHFNDLGKLAPTGGILLMVAWLTLGLCTVAKYPR